MPLSRFFSRNFPFVVDGMRAIHFAQAKELIFRSHKPFLHSRRYHKSFEILEIVCRMSLASHLYKIIRLINHIVLAHPTAHILSLRSSHTISSACHKLHILSSTFATNISSMKSVLKYFSPDSVTKIVFNFHYTLQYIDRIHRQTSKDSTSR